MNKSTAPPLQSSILCAIIIVIAHNGTTDNSIAAKNPFTYRGYYYDSDIRLYYLQTRYYDSVTGRFINADGYVSTGQGMLGNNMYAYCNNNPVMFTDPTGELPRWAIACIVVAAVVVTAAVTTAAVIISNHVKNSNIESDIEDQLQESYTEDEAAKAIKDITGKNVKFYDDDKGQRIAQIENSFYVMSKSERIYAAAVLSRTQGFERSTASIAAEWRVHNVAYVISFGTSSSAMHVDIESKKEDDFIVRAAIFTFLIMGWC